MSIENSINSIKEQLNRDESEYLKLRDNYFLLYDKMDDPERSKAKMSWSLNNCIDYGEPKFICNAILWGIDIHEDEDKEDYWIDIMTKYKGK